MRPLDTKSTSRFWYWATLVQVLVAGPWLVVLLSPSLAQGVGVRLLTGFLTASGLWYLVGWYVLTRELLRPYILFLGIALAFNAGQAVLFVLGVSRHGFLFHKFPEGLTLETLTLVGGLRGPAPRSAPGVEMGEAAGGPRPQESDQLQPCAPSAGCWWWYRRPSRRPCSGATFPTCSQAGYFSIFRGSSPTGVLAARYVLAPLLLPGILLVVAASPELPDSARCSRG